MSQIDRIGSFRGKIIDKAISKSSGGFPQAVLQLEAVQMWDPDNGVWVDWNYDEREAMAYMVLFGKNKKPTLSARQLMKATGWDGVSFVEFQEKDDLQTDIQWRMEENTYEGNTTIKCQWIDDYNAEPGKKVQKLEKADIAKLQAQYASQLQALSGGPKPKSAPPAAPKQKVDKSTPATEIPSAADPTPPADPALGTAEPSASADTGEETTSAPEPPAAPPAEKPKRTRKPKTIDMNTAWTEYFKESKAAGHDDVKITQAWTGIIQEKGGNDAVGKDWGPIKAAALNALTS